MAPFLTLAAALRSAMSSSLRTDTESPVISMKLADNGSVQEGFVDAAGVPCVSHAADASSCDRASVQTKYAFCYVDTANENNCPLPETWADDHHDGTVQVTEQVHLVVESDAKGSPSVVNRDVTCGHVGVDSSTCGLNYDQRGEYEFTYDATDDAGNPAETVNFRVFLRDDSAPAINEGPMGSTEYLNYFTLPSATANDGYDGDVTSTISYTVHRDIEACRSHSTDFACEADHPGCAWKTNRHGTEACYGGAQTYSSDEDIVFDTNLFGDHIIEIQANDYAGAFGENGQNNVANDLGSITISAGKVVTFITDNERTYTEEVTSSPTPFPTVSPTSAPTSAPTYHPCDDGNHGCDQDNGICVKEGDGYSCECPNTHICTFGCSQPHTAHTCTVTDAPTNAPTAPPTWGDKILGGVSTTLDVEGYSSLDSDEQEAFAEAVAEETGVDPTTVSVRELDGTATSRRRLASTDVAAEILFKEKDEAKQQIIVNALNSFSVANFRNRFATKLTQKNKPLSGSFNMAAPVNTILEPTIKWTRRAGAMEICPIGNCGQRRMKVLIDFIRELDTSDKKVTHHFKETLSSTDWEVLEDAVVEFSPGVFANKYQFNSYIEVGCKGNANKAGYKCGTATLKVIAYYFWGKTTNVVSGGDSFAARKGAMKFDMEVTDWPFKSSDHKLEIGITMQPFGAKNMAASLRASSHNNENKKEIDLGDMYYDTPNKGKLDGVDAVVDIQSSMQGQKTTMTYTVPAFNSKFEYDPLIGGYQPVDCEVSAWSEYGTCSASCGGGVKTRTRTVTVEAALGGEECPTLQDSAECGSCACPIDCQENAWDDWAACSDSCGTTGTTNRWRTIATHPSEANAECGMPAGASCGDIMESDNCNRFACPVDCELNDFGDFGECSLTCGGVGQHTRSRTVKVQPENGGSACGDLSETSTCNEGPCPVHCETSNWSDWGACTQSCESGSHTRTRVITQHAEHGGYVCPNLSDTEPCNEHCCPTDCQVGAWGEYDSFVGGGMNLKRTREITVPDTCGGASCPDLSEEKIYTHPDCGNSYRSKDAGCSKTCGTGFTKTKHLFIRCGSAPVKFHLAYTGYSKCNTHDCTTEAEWNQPHKDIPDPEIIMDEDMELEETVGNWAPVTQHDVDSLDLTPHPGMMKFVPSA